MKTTKFKTNINCSGCVAQVTPVLNAAVGNNNWEVDIENREKILTISNADVDVNQIKDLLQKAGFKAEKVNTDQR